MSNRDDEFYDRDGRRPSRRDDRYRDDRRPVRRSSDRYDDYEERPARRRSYDERDDYASSRSRNASRSGSSRGGASRGGSRKKKNNKALFLLIAEVLVAAILVIVAYNVFIKMGATKVGKVNLDEEAISKTISENVASNTQMKGYTNIALFGVDTRDEAKNPGSIKKKTRSDTIIIASINNETGEIKLCSVYRDTYLNLSNDSYTKCNAAYAEGGPMQAISMLNMNLDMDIKDFITIGFKGLSDVVDALGGVEIEVTEDEITHLNNYQSSMATELKMDYKPVESAGVQTLNGLQATAYCRIRYTKGDDFKRAQRQRTVLMACLEKAQGMSPDKLEEIANKAFGETYTSLDIQDILALLKNISKYKVVDDNGFPEESMRGTGTVGKKGSCVIPKDLASNVKWLHQFLFDDSSYEVSPDVQKYSDKIQSDTSAYVN
ncbi:LytR family transcriptional regulator [Butyrivibrio sp. X503]|uniref:LCP family protein n=1 Tax=Butyrivibrio sp. X503 TaxID=2364878 RepID=UPI000EA93C02|nr:LCP family protein [Butyrivibrio sp. X503]RKM54511.1 LytR family transcriptional regulator [Butyrivibrio sp. X503]